jgi:hypothetical protein
MASAAVCTVSTLPSSNHLRWRLPCQPLQFALHQFAAEAERHDDLMDSDTPQQLQMPFEQAAAAELQQAFGQLAALRLLHSQSSSGGKNNGAHVSPDRT